MKSVEANPSYAKLSLATEYVNDLKIQIHQRLAQVPKLEVDNSSQAMKMSTFYHDCGAVVSGACVYSSAARSSWQSWIATVTRTAGWFQHQVESVTPDVELLEPSTVGDQYFAQATAARKASTISLRTP